MLTRTVSSAAAIEARPSNTVAATAAIPPCSFFTGVSFQSMFADMIERNFPRHGQVNQVRNVHNYSL